jgi:hypothetical protein
VPKREKYAPKHRQAPPTSIAKDAPKKVLRNTVMFSSVAVAATGVAVSGGLLNTPSTSVTNAAQDLGKAVHPATADAAQVADRREVVSRSADRRAATDPAKEAALAFGNGPAVTHHENLSSGDPRDIARALLPQYGFSSDQFSCLDALWVGESGWRVDADNPTSSAYGIPQALPGEKMASAGPDWQTNPATQIKWGLGYIADRYGSPCGALSFKEGHNWY